MVAVPNFGNEQKEIKLKSQPLRILVSLRKAPEGMLNTTNLNSQMCTNLPSASCLTIFDISIWAS